VANLFLRGVSNFHDGVAQDSFVWLPSDVAVGLATVVRGIQKHASSEKKNA
jgi:hypothetical protein